MPMVRGLAQDGTASADAGAGAGAPRTGLSQERWFVSYVEELLGRRYVAGPFGDGEEAAFWAQCLTEGRAFKGRE